MKQHHVLSRFVNFFAPLIVLAVVLNQVMPAQADLLVTSRESNSVVRFTDSGQFIGVLIQGDPTNAANNTAMNGGLVGPIGIATKPGDDDHLYVVSSGITQTGFSTGVSSVLQYDLKTGAFVGSYATDDLNNSSDLVFDASGNALVSNFSNLFDAFHDNVVKFEADGTPTGTFAQLPFPMGAVAIALGPSNDLFVSTFFGNQIYRYNATTGAQIGTEPWVAQVLDGAWGAGLLYHDGYLYASNASQAPPASASHVIMRYDITDPSLSTAFITDVGGVHLAFPGDMAIAPNGNLLVASLGNDFSDPTQAGQILEYDIDTGAFVGIYAQGFLNGPAAMTFAAVPEPSSVALALMGTALTGVGVWRRRRRSA
ncbi:MAG: PEP-CTERM sorting domain-containing protein [Pirellulales bacterium]|nr:PEP-CTERM sorting domain-containing protein [Pirellulales bacterium]